MTPTTSSGPAAPTGPPGADPPPTAVVTAATAPATGWLAQALAAVRRDPRAADEAFPLAGRRVGRDPLRPDADPAGTAHGTVDDAARAAVVVALADAHGSDALALADHLVVLYRDGDTAERRGVLRGLDVLTATAPGPLPGPVVAVGRDLAGDALRANDTSLVAAAVGPFAAAHLDQHTWRHAVVKLVFQQTSLDAVAGLDRRADAELARMATDLAAERRAAGRPVPDDLARIATVRADPSSQPDQPGQPDPDDHADRQEP
ncbi:EboA domain-containing protein [Cellulomonas hominis]|uniref:EboA domain-containing protein n=1 Tax=Cellulomonas hominis TaxID=156981 RepID=UPI001B93DB0F|nr:EboA domain-containing protein [Cellulomonas hominis]VTR78573.1 hypothetical protein CHMI_03356 [Cellulomonas hominis]